MLLNKMYGHQYEATEFLNSGVDSPALSMLVAKVFDLYVKFIVKSKTNVTARA